MIPLSAIPWKLVGYVAGMALLIVMGWRIHAWHESHKRLPEVEAQLEQERTCAPSTACQQRAEALAEQARIEAEERATEALESVRKAEEQARRDAAAWRAKYRKAVQENPECADWSSQPVRCPL